LQQIPKIIFARRLKIKVPNVQVNILSTTSSMKSNSKGAVKVDY
jgi:hypothetical protein